jgi:hypothetical protein
MIGEIYREERRYEPIKAILINEIETAKNFPLFQAKILFILIVRFFSTC